jgi:hypothetical protein
MIDIDKIYELKVDLPFLKKGKRFSFDYDLGWVYGFENVDKRMEYPLREGLAGYLWLLKTENDKYLKEV